MAKNKLLLGDLELNIDIDHIFYVWYNINCNHWQTPLSKDIEILGLGIF